jgi:hypothetical protein
MGGRLLGDGYLPFTRKSLALCGIPTLIAKVLSMCRPLVHDLFINKNRLF